MAHATWNAPESYTRIPLPQSLPRNHIRDFDVNANYDDTKAELMILEDIRVADAKWSQIVHCKVTKAPKQRQSSRFQSRLDDVVTGRSLVIKAYDYEYYPSSFGGPWDNDEEADGRFSREFSAYQYYHTNHRGGYPESMPKFYGGWVIKVDAGKNEQGHKQYRYVRLILIEYIDGRSIESLCFCGREPGWMGELEPLTLEVPFRRRRSGPVYITFDLKNRQLAIKKMLHGLVVGMHIGFRVVFLDHTETEVFELTDEGADLAPPIVTKLPFPPHPKERCSAVAPDSFYGWWPLSLPNGTDEEDEDRTKQFADWLVSPTAFGPLQEAKDELDRLTAEGRLWPHPYAMYSTFDTLRKILKGREVAGLGDAAEEEMAEAEPTDLGPLATRGIAAAPDPTGRPDPIRQPGPSEQPDRWQENRDPNGPQGP
ncbi:hypothetical protein CMUS01_09734 [Colletotrichum musicola]|uniref:Uncharacterized protein n=1 Tax=Colletotrichum musicola TaxID=2175873 RepID=A0A8H6K751_9PEZI|nr:hypothetical protein CMUS01_09734 [Colletotrichum musicola]